MRTCDARESFTLRRSCSVVNPSDTLPLLLYTATHVSAFLCYYIGVVLPEDGMEKTGREQRGCSSVLGSPCEFCGQHAAPTALTRQRAPTYVCVRVTQRPIRTRVVKSSLSSFCEWESGMVPLCGVCRREDVGGRGGWSWLHT